MELSAFVVVNATAQFNNQNCLLFPMKVCVTLKLLANEKPLIFTIHRTRTEQKVNKQIEVAS